MQTLVITFADRSIAMQYDGEAARRVAAFLFLEMPSAPVRQDPGPDGSPCEDRLELSSVPGQPLTLRDAESLLFSTHDEGAMAERLQGEVCRRIAAAGTSGLAFHAAGLAWRGNAVMCPGAMGRGKSTLAAALVRDGWQYMTDEFVFVPPESRLVHAFTRPLNLRPSARHLFARLLDAPVDRPARLNHPGGCLVHPALLGNGGTAGTNPLAAIVVPDYQPGAPYKATPLSPARCGLALMESLVNARNLDEHGFREVTRLARRVPAWRLTYSDLEGLGARLQSLLDPLPAPSAPA